MVSSDTAPPRPSATTPWTSWFMTFPPSKPWPSWPPAEQGASLCRRPPSGQRPGRGSRPPHPGGLLSLLEEVPSASYPQAVGDATVPQKKVEFEGSGPHLEFTAAVPFEPLGAFTAGLTVQQRPTSLASSTVEPSHWLLGPSSRLGRRATKPKRSSSMPLAAKAGSHAPRAPVLPVRHRLCAGRSRGPASRPKRLEAKV